MLCFVPFGMVFYLISFILAMYEFIKSITENKTTTIKSEIVNDEQYLTLKKAGRVKYLQDLKKQILAEITNLHKEIEKEQNKLNDMPADVAKYVKTKDIMTQKHEILKLENKIIAIDELIKSEKEKTKEKERMAGWQNYLDDDL